MYLCTLIHTHVIKALIHLHTYSNVLHLTHIHIHNTYTFTHPLCIPWCTYILHIHTSPIHRHFYTHLPTCLLIHIAIYIYTRKHSHTFILKLTYVHLHAQTSHALIHAHSYAHKHLRGHTLTHIRTCARLSNHSVASKRPLLCGLLCAACVRELACWSNEEKLPKNRFGHCQALYPPHLPWTLFPHCPPWGPREKSWAERWSSWGQTHWEQPQLSQIQPRARHVVW